MGAVVAMLLAFPAAPFHAFCRVPAYVRAAPDPGAKIVGELEAGDRVYVSACSPGCDAPDGWGLLGEDGAVRLSRLTLEAPQDAPAPFDEFVYGRVRAGGAPVRRVPLLTAPVIEVEEAGHDLAFRDDPALLATGWLRRHDGGFVPVARVRLAKPSRFSGEHDPELPLAFLRRKAKVGDRELARYDRLPVLSEKGRTISVEGGTLPRSAVRIARAVKRPAQVPPGARWVHIDLSEQVLTAWEGDRCVLATLVSTGKPGWGTAEGLFLGWRKTIHGTMRGRREPYVVEEVPHVIYFHGSDALHGAYWHDLFGERLSHGCVNLSPQDAAWIFNWAPPPLPEGWHTVTAGAGEALYVDVGR